MSKTEATIYAAALATGAYGKDSVHCRRSLDMAAGKCQPQYLPGDPAEATPKKERQVAKPTPKGEKVKSRTRLVLKANKPIRAQLTEAANHLGGTRLQPVGFDNYSAFLNGFDLDADGNAEVALIPIKGSEPVKGASVKLIVKGGVPSVTKVGKAK